MSPVKRILIVNKYHFVSGGAERYYLSVGDSLRKRGIEAIPLSINYARTIPGPHQKYFLEPVVRSGEAKIQNQTPGLTERVKLARQVIYNIAAKRAVERIYREKKPQVAYLLNINNHISPSVIDACTDKNIPVVMRLSDFNLVCASNMYFRDGRPCMDCKRGFHHALMHRCVHGSLSKTLVSVFANSLHRWMGIYRKVSAFVAPSLVMKKELEELGFPPDIVHQLNTFVAPKEIREADRTNPYVLFVGRFAEYKGAQVAAEAFSKLRLENVTLRLMGDEEDEDSQKLKARISAMDGSRIEILPFQRDVQEVTRMIQGSLFTVVPSMFYENLPHTILESFACGRPVIATRLGSIPEVVEDGQNGVLFEPGDIADCSKKMEYLIQNEHHREEMAKNARRAITDRYSEEAHLDRLISIFDRVVSKSREGESAG